MSKALVHKITEWSFYVAAFGCAFYELNKLTFLFFAVCFFVERIVNAKQLKISLPSRDNVPLYACVLFYLWLVITLLWTENVEVGKTELVKRCMFLFIPLLALLKIPKGQYNYKGALVALVIGVVVSNVLRLIETFPSSDITNAEQFRQIWSLQYRGDIPLASGIGITHPSVLGMLECFSIIIFAYLKRDFLVRVKRYPRAIYYVCFALVYFFFFFSIRLSDARMAMIIYMVVTCIVVAVFLWNRNYRKLLFVTILLISTAGAYLLLTSPRMENMEFTQEGLRHVDPRYEQWRCGLMAISENNLWTGVGIGDGTDVFNEVHSRETFKELYFDVDSAHCQWIDGTLEYGLVGSLLLLVVFLSNCFALRSRRGFVFVLSGTIMWMLFVLTEPFLSRFTPIYIFVFFLLICYWMKQEPKVEESDVR